MRISKAVGYALIASIAFTMLAERSGGASLVAPTSFAHPRGGSQSLQQPAFQNSGLNRFLAMHRGIVPSHRMTTRSFMDPRALGKPLLFVADAHQGNVNIYLQGGKNKMVGQIADLPGDDLATDAAGNLYSANFAFSYTNVTIYAPPYTNGPKLTLAGGRENLGVAVSRQGIVAVMTCTIPSGSQCGQGVIFYAAGSTTPCATVLVDASSFSGGIFFGAFDRKGNLYVDGANASNGPVFAKIDGGCNAKKAKALTITNTVIYAGSIKVDKEGRIAVLAAADPSGSAAVIDTYDPPKEGSLGSPVSTTPLTNPDFPTFTFAFRASGHGLWAGYETPSDSSGGASEYTYPAGGAPEKTVIGAPESITYGIAVTPALVP